MPTSKKRINITFDEDVYDALARLAKSRAKPVAGVGLSLIEEALELQEDFYFARIADKRLARKEKRLAHEVAWK